MTCRFPAAFVAICALGAARLGIPDSVRNIGWLEASFLAASAGYRWLFTIVAQFSGETLCDNEAHRRGNRIGLDAHVDIGSASEERRWYAASREQVAGLRRFDGNFGGFQISNFTDHDHVGSCRRMLGGGRKGQSHLVIDVN